MVKELEKRLSEIEKKIERATAARMALPFGSSRAKVTTANARLNSYLEARQRIWDEIEGNKNNK